MGLTTKVYAGVNANLSEAHEGGERRFDIADAVEHTLAHGAAAGQADVLFRDQRTLAASASEELDLAGVLTDHFGKTATFARVSALVVEAAAPNVNDVLVGGAATNGVVSLFADATDAVRVKPGGKVVFFAPVGAGYPVTAGTGDKLAIANSGSGSAVDYTITIIGRSA